MSNIEFDRALKFSLIERGTPDLMLKSKQSEALRSVVQQKRDVLAVLPTGYGKSLIYQLLPSMFNYLLYGGKYCSIAIIVSPLTALMIDQVEKIKKQGQSAAIIQATVPLKCRLPPLFSFLSRRISFLSRRVLFLSRITEAFSLEYITRKKPACISKTVLLYSHVSFIECHCNILCVSIDCSIHVKQTYRTFVYNGNVIFSNKLQMTKM